MRYSPANLALSDSWIASVVKFQRQGSIGSWTDDVLGCWTSANGWV